MKPQLFLLHFAGGSRYSYNFMKDHLPGFEFVPLELPGRGKRVREDLVRNFEVAAGDIRDSILEQLNSPEFLVYGHSMGAILALKVTAMLEADGKYPLHMIVSGNPGPGQRRGRKRWQLAEDEFRAELRSIGGIPEEVFDNEALFGFFLPVLKADFELLEECDDKALQPVRSPIYAIMGDMEESADRIGGWRRFSLSDVRCKVLEGGHFFIREQVKEVCQIITDCYKTLLI